MDCTVRGRKKATTFFFKKKTTGELRWKTRGEGKTSGAVHQKPRACAHAMHNAVALECYPSVSCQDAEVFSP